MGFFTNIDNFFNHQLCLVRNFFFISLKTGDGASIDLGHI